MRCHRNPQQRRGSTKNRRDRRWGAAAVEFALVLPFLMLILLVVEIFLSMDLLLQDIVTLAFILKRVL